MDPPPLETYRDLVFNKWWTDNSNLPASERLAHSNGEYALRCFKGQYKATATLIASPQNQ